MITFLYQKGDYDMSETRTCPNCGAPVPEGICQYCGTVFESTAAPEDYPEVICKYAGITFHEIRFYSGVILFSVIASICIISQSDYLEGVMFALVFSLPGIIIGFVLIKKILTFIMLTLSGANADGEVYGYKNDLIKYGDDYCQIAEVMVNAPAGKKVLLVPLHKTSHPYPLNSRVKVKTYKDFAKITGYDLV